MVDNTTIAIIALSGTTIFFILAFIFEYITSKNLRARNKELWNRIERYRKKGGMYGYTKEQESHR